MARERDHGADRRASVSGGTGSGGTGGTVPCGAGRDRGAALSGDLVAGAGTDLPRGGRGAGLRATLEELAARYHAIGPEALGDQRRRNGRTAALLTEAVLSALAERVQAPPAEGGVWSGPKVAAWIARHLGLAQGHPQRGWEALRRIGWSIQAPRPRHARAAAAAEQAAFEGGWGTEERRVGQECR